MMPLFFISILGIALLAMCVYNGLTMSIIPILLLLIMLYLFYGKLLCDFKYGINHYDIQRKIIGLPLDPSKGIMYLPMNCVFWIYKDGRIEPTPDKEKVEFYKDIIAMRKDYYNFILVVSRHYKKRFKKEKDIERACKIVKESGLPISYISTRVPDYPLIKINQYKNTKVFVYENWSEYL